MYPECAMYTLGYKWLKLTSFHEPSHNLLLYNSTNQYSSNKYISEIYSPGGTAAPPPQLLKVVNIPKGKAPMPKWNWKPPPSPNPNPGIKPFWGSGSVRWPGGRGGSLSLMDNKYHYFKDILKNQSYTVKLILCYFHSPWILLVSRASSIKRNHLVSGNGCLTYRAGLIVWACLQPLMEAGPAWEKKVHYSWWLQKFIALHTNNLLRLGGKHVKIRGCAGRYVDLQTFITRAPFEWVSMLTTSPSQVTQDMIRPLNKSLDSWILLWPPLLRNVS